MSVERYWRDLLEGERLLRQVAERQLAEWRRAAEELAMEFAPGVTIVTPEDLLKVAEILRARLRDNSGILWKKRCEQLEAELEALRAQKSAAEVETEVVEEVEKGEDRKRRAWPLTHPAPEASVNIEELKKLISSWPVRAPFTRQNASRAYMFLAVLGHLGLSGRPRVSAIVAKMAGVGSPNTGSLQRILTLLSKLKFVKLVKEQGAPFALVLLTDKGKEFYSELAGRPPVTSEAELLLASHPGNIAHAAFCVWVRELAEKFGYEVQIPQPTHSTWQPDLLFKGHDGAYGVEFERALNPDPEARRAKWLRAKEIQGFVAVVTTDANVRFLLREEIKRVGVKAKLTDISHILEKEEFWAEEI